MSIRFAIFSDLHRHQWDKGADPDLIKHINNDDVDAIIVAGDIDLGKNTPSYLKYIYDGTKKPIIFVFGNHEYYGASFNEIVRTTNEELKEYKDIYVLDRDNLTISIKGEEIDFVGCTLWADMTLYGDQEHALKVVQKVLDDRPDMILPNGKVMTSRDHADLYCIEKAWLEDYLEKTRYDEKRKVIVTHYPPSFLCQPRHFLAEKKVRVQLIDLKVLCYNISQIFGFMGIAILTVIFM